MKKVKEDGSGERNKDYKEGVFRFMVKRQSLIKKIPIWNKWLGIHSYHSNPNNYNASNYIQMVKIVRNLLIIDCFVFCYQTMDNHF